MLPEKILIKKMRLKETVPPIFRVMLVALITSTLAMVPGCSGKKDVAVSFSWSAPSSISRPWVGPDFWANPGAADWSNQTWMKVVLSQTIFANLATLPKGAKNSKSSSSPGIYWSQKESEK